MTNNKNTLDVSHDQDADEYLITLTPEIMKMLDLNIGDSIAWVQNDDNTFTLRKATHEEISKEENTDSTKT